MTFIFIIATVIFSIIGFNNQEVFNKYKFNPYMVTQRNEWYRLLTSGFLHADYMHLIVNMFVLYFFGTNVEKYLDLLEAEGILHIPAAYFIALYIISLLVANLPALIKHKNDHYYNAIGASGAVSAVLFTSIFFNPWAKIMVFPIPVPIPGIVFGPIYLIYSHIMSKRNMDNIGHDAHFAGAVFGFLFPVFIDFSLISNFINQF